jgi:hypothetical protein
VTIGNEKQAKKNNNNILFPFIVWFAKLGYFVWYFWWLTYSTFSRVSLSSHPNTCPFRFGWLLRPKGKNKNKKFGNPERIISSFFKSVKDPPVTSSNFNCRKMHTEWWRLSVTKKRKSARA